MTPTVVQSSPQMNLLGYMLKSLIERKIHTKRGVEIFQRLHGTFWVGASSMQVTLKFSENKLEISSGKTHKADAWVWGRLDALLGVALHNTMLTPILSRRLRAGGKIWRLFSFIKLLRSEEKK